MDKFCRKRDLPLWTLADFLATLLPGRAHYALADAQMAGEIWLRMVADIKDNYGI